MRVRSTAECGSLLPLSPRQPAGVARSAERQKASILLNGQPLRMHIATLLREAKRLIASRLAGKSGSRLPHSTALSATARLLTNSRTISDKKDHRTTRPVRRAGRTARIFTPTARRAPSAARRPTPKARREPPTAHRSLKPEHRAIQTATSQTIRRPLPAARRTKTTVRAHEHQSRHIPQYASITFSHARKS